MSEFFYQNNGQMDIYLFHEGNNKNLYKFLGSHIFHDEYGMYTKFSVWAPNAKYVNLVGDFNNWDDFSLPMKRIDDVQIWEICVRDVKIFDSYKYRIVSKKNEILYKADPFAFHSELRPETASKVYDIEGYQWRDENWLKKEK